MSTLSELRRSHHSKIGSQIVRFSERNNLLYPNFADGSSQSSVFIANGIAEVLGFSQQIRSKISGQTAGTLFEKFTTEFIEEAFSAIKHLRPGRWQYQTTRTRISNFAQYQHLENLAALVYCPVNTLYYLSFDRPV